MLFIDRRLRFLGIALLVGALAAMASRGGGGGGGGDGEAPNQQPWAFPSATPTRGVYPLSVTFDGTACIDYDGTIVSYRWDVGDGKPAVDRPSRISTPLPAATASRSR